MFASSAALSTDVGQIVVYTLSTALAAAVGVGARSLWNMSKSMKEVHEVTMGKKDSDGNVVIPSVREQFAEIGAQFVAVNKSLSSQNVTMAQQGETLGTLEHEVQTNGGDSLKDEVKAVRADLREHIAQVADNETHQRSTTPVKRAPAKKAVAKKAPARRTS